RAAAGEAGAADLPERERVAEEDVSAAWRTRTAHGSSVVPRRLRRRRHGVRTIHRTPHARFRFRPETRSRVGLLACDLVFCKLATAAVRFGNTADGAKQRSHAPRGRGAAAFAARLAWHRHCCAPVAGRRVTP